GAGGLHGLGRVDDEATPAGRPCRLDEMLNQRFRDAAPPRRRIDAEKAEAGGVRLCGRRSARTVLGHVGVEHDRTGDLLALERDKESDAWLFGLPADLSQRSEIVWLC